MNIVLSILGIILAIWTISGIIGTFAEIIEKLTLEPGTDLYYNR